MSKIKKQRFYESWAFLIIICLSVPIMFRSIVYAPFHIPSGSMKPTLLVGDFIFVSKFSYGYTRYSFPLGIKFFDGRLWSDKPVRGDVVVFRPSPTPRVDFIKRLIGLPGDVIQVKNGLLYINEKEVKRVRIQDFVEEVNGSVKRIKHYIETLPNGVSYSILDEYPNGRLDNTPRFVVPEGHYFMMGDNRDNSADSRTDTVGFVPEVNLVGRADLVLLSTSSSLWKVWEWYKTLRTERFFMKISTIIGLKEQ